MDQLLQVNIFKIKARLTVNDAEEGESVSLSMGSYGYISKMVEEVINIMILKKFDFGNGGSIKLKMQGEDLKVGDFFEMKDKDYLVNYFQREVMEKFNNQKPPGYSLNYGTNSIIYEEKENFRSFSSDFKLGVDGIKKNINIKFSIYKHFEGTEEKAIICCAKMVNIKSCTIS